MHLSENLTKSCLLSLSMVSKKLLIVLLFFKGGRCRGSSFLTCHIRKTKSSLTGIAFFLLSFNLNGVALLNQVSFNVVEIN